MTIRTVESRQPDSVTTSAPRPETSTPRRKKHREPILLHAMLAAYCLSTSGAFVWYLMTSLKTNPEFLSTSPWSLPGKPRFENFADAWRVAGIGQFVANSFYVTVVSVVVGLTISSMAAYALARIRFRGRNLAIALILGSMLMPGFGAIIPLYFLLRNLHLLGTLTGLILVYIATQVPLSVFILRSFYVSLPVELEEAAYLDGASASRTFFQVVLPQTAPVLASLAILNALNAWNEFLLALVLLPDRSQQTIAVGLLGLSVEADSSGRWVQLFAGLLISSVPMLLIFAVAQRRIAGALTFGGLKG